MLKESTLTLTKPAAHQGRLIRNLRLLGIVVANIENTDDISDCTYYQQGNTNNPIDYHKSICCPVDFQNAL